MLRHHQVLEHRHALKQPDVLEGAGDTRAGIDVVVVQPFQIEALAVGMGACSAQTTSSTSLTAPTAPTATSVTPAAVPAAVTAITITGVTTLSVRGETGRLSAIVTYADGTMQDRTSASRWTSGNQAVVTINPEGVVTAVGDGQTTITVEFGTMSAAKTIRVDLP